MAFCTTCGASVQGAFCAQCGTPLSVAGSQAAPHPPQPGPAAAPMMSGSVPVASARKHGPLFWILITVAGLFVFLVVAIVGLGMYGLHKAKQAGFDAELMQKNPAYAAAKIAVSMNPEVEEISHDDDAGTMTVRDKKTGKTSTISFSDAKSGHFSFTAEDENGKTATVDIGVTGKLPSWIPTYPGASQEGTFSVKGTNDEGEEGGTMAFTTSDSGSKVLAFYQSKANDMGLKVTENASSPDGGTLVMTDDAERKSLTVIAGSHDGGKTGISLTYGLKK